MLPLDVIYSDRISDFLVRVRGIRPDCSYVIYCSKGNLVLRFNGDELTVREQEMLMVVPGSEVSYVNSTADCECRMIAVYGDMRREISGTCLREDINWLEKSNYIRENPILPLTHYQNEICRVFADFYTSFSTKITSEVDDKVVRNILTAGIITLLDWIGSHMPTVNLPHTQGRTNIVFKQYLSLIQESKGRKREVQWYADKLSITPKYLTTICHNVSGKSASEIANESTVIEIKRLLTQTDLSSKEICQQLDFVTHSFFCRYVKREIGMSAKEYRKKHKK